ncbi:sigma-54 interaction domain-containing protein [Alkalispirochaeta americana]|nr:sigma-54 dependent transcriptional regulator [Alkalispirochaeta americana]
MNQTPPSILTDLWEEACRSSSFPQGEEKALESLLFNTFSKIARENLPGIQKNFSCTELALILFPSGKEFRHGSEGIQIYRISRNTPSPEVEITTSKGPEALLIIEGAHLEGRIARTLSYLPGYPSWSQGILIPLTGSTGDTPEETLLGALLVIPAGTRETKTDTDTDTDHRKKLKSYIEATLAPPFAGLLENARIYRHAHRPPRIVTSHSKPRNPQEQNDQAETLVGTRGGLRNVLDRIESVVPSSLPVLLLGESGTGKEVIARRIHHLSPRHEKPFIRINCGAIAPELIDSELFGHERGAFTGAIKRKRGWFERAHGGTLLLDEVGDLPLPAQVRLLRVLQEGTFERVGGEEEISVDVRIIAATHRDLPGMIQQGAFREDLWYRLSGYPIVIPPLRERQQDIPALAHHFCQRSSRRFGIKTQSITEGDVDILRAYQWPGNIRELASVMDRAVLLSEGGSLDFHKALERIVPLGPEPSHNINPSSGGCHTEPLCFFTLDEAIEEHIRRALRRTSGKIEGPGGAARLLAVNPHTLRARMRRQGINWNEYRPGQTLPDRGGTPPPP